MKKILYLLLLFSGLLKAQIVNIPDANFKAKLLEASPSNYIASTETPLYNVDMGQWIVSNYIKIDTNNDGEIQINEASLIKYLNIGYSNILNLTGIEAFSNLQYLNGESNQLPTLDLSSLTNLQYLNCNFNQLPTLDVSGLTNLQTLDCKFNQLSTLDISGLTNLQTLDCIFNQLSTLDISGLTNLKDLYCSNNQLSTLDVSGLTNLQNLYCLGNQLTSLFIKNNNTSWQNLNFYDNPYLSYICADEEDLTLVQNKINQAGLSIDTNCHVNSYCSFTPGGEYNTITGTVKFDANNNGCDATEISQPNIRLDMTQWGVNSATFINNSGNYNFYTTFADQMVTPNIENPSYFTITPPNAIITFPDTNFLTTTQDFCITPNGIHSDLEVVIAPITPARPGFDAVYQIVYKNKGNQTLSGAVSMTFNDDKLDFVTANPTPTTQQPNTLTWDYTNLLPFENRSIIVTLNVNNPTETPAVNIGDVLTFNANVTPLTADEIPTDNQFNYNQTVVGSFDPNDITCIEGTIVPPSEIGNYLHYIINFENTGTDIAENIVVKTEIDPTQFDINTLQQLNVSHNVYTRITNNEVEFIFENIELAPSGGGGSTGGHGHVLMKIKTKNVLQEGDTVSKKANIYFDYNAPIGTGLSNTTFASLSVDDNLDNTAIAIYPNPATSFVTVNAKDSIQSIALFDVNGRLLQTIINHKSLFYIDLTPYSKGIYFIKTKTEKGINTQKVIKE